MAVRGVLVYPNPLLKRVAAPAQAAERRNYSEPPRPPSAD
jgi:hypothetical protein